MKRIAGLLVVIMSSAVLLLAQDGAKASETGWVCNSKCVVQSAGRATCDRNCTDTSGETVFITADGTVSSIANPNMVTPQMKKKEKVTREVTDESENVSHFESYDDIVRYAGGGG